MKNNVIQLHNVSPEQFKNEILSGVQDKLEALQKSLKPNKTEYLTRKDTAELLDIL